MAFGRALLLVLDGDGLMRAAGRLAMGGLLVVALVLAFACATVSGLLGIAWVPDSEGMSRSGGAPSTGGRLAEIPTEQLAVMQASAEASGCGLPWPVLAAIARLESGFGRNMATSSAGAIGYGQFLPATWAAYGRGGDPYDYRDALPAMARFLCALGAGTNLERALWSYSGCNPLLDSTCHRTDTYVRDALALARGYTLVPSGYDRVSGPIPSSVHGSVVQHALRYLGVPYLWGGTSQAGVDCSGLVWLAYREMGVTLPRVAQAQYQATARVGRAELQPGDLAFFWGTDGVGWVSHVGIYVGDGQMINAPTTGARVRIDPVFTGYWGAHYHGAGRVLS